MAIYILAFRGTQDAVDWKANGSQVVPLVVSKQYAQAVKLSRAVQHRLRNKRVIICGHSLGGGLATAAAIGSERTAISFNPAGLRAGTVKGNVGHARIMTHVYRVKGEILTTAQDMHPVLAGTGGLLLGPFGGLAGFTVAVASPNTVGVVHTLKNPNPSYGTVKRHDMSVVIEALEIHR
jgi:pimeloyl-ACP methyl ester carboxylesterase